MQSAHEWERTTARKLDCACVCRLSMSDREATVTWSWSCSGGSTEEVGTRRLSHLGALSSKLSLNIVASIVVLDAQSTAQYISCQLCKLQAFFEKNDMMLPWLPFGPAAFFGFAAAVDGAELGLGLGAGFGASSSEKDSQAGSCMVTAT